MVLKSKLNWPVRLLASHGFGLVWSIRPEIDWTWIRQAELTVWLVNRTNWPVHSELFDLIQIFFLASKRCRFEGYKTSFSKSQPLPASNPPPMRCDKLPPPTISPCKSPSTCLCKITVAWVASFPPYHCKPTSHPLSLKPWL